MILYTDIDPFCCKVLQARIDDGSLPHGDVLEKDIREITADDLEGYRQIHLFAGIGGFGLAQKWSNWPPDRTLVTGGPPCQPFSSAARGRINGASDNRHLWPEMLRIVRISRPDRMLFENVVNIDRLALEEVVFGLEAYNYEVAPPLEIPACAVGQNHWRPRIWVCGYANSNRQPRCAIDAETPELQNCGHERSGTARTNGLPTKLARDSAIGNAIVPQVAEVIMRAMRETGASKDVPGNRSP